MTTICPKCSTELDYNPYLTNDKKTRRLYKRTWCPKCLGRVVRRECVACDAPYFCLQDGNSYWNNHVCDEKRLANRDRMYEQEERLPRTPTEIERYEEGLRMLEGDTNE